MGPDSQDGSKERSLLQHHGSPHLDYHHKLMASSLRSADLRMFPAGGWETKKKGERIHDASLHLEHCPYVSRVIAI